MPSVLITGASRGIGRAATIRLAADGWDVIAGVRREDDGAALVSDAGDRVRPIVLDITDDKDLAGLEAVLPTRLDAVVNNAGIVVGGPIEGLSLGELRRQFDVNVTGQVAVTQAALPRLRAATGRIVFVSSLSGRISTPMTGAYNASKFALEAVADALRMELRPWGISVILVEPAQTDTDMWRTAGDVLEQTVGDLTPNHRQLYERHIAGARKGIPRSQKMAAPVDGAAATIAFALTARRPRARYIVGTAPKLMNALVHLLPTPARDAVLAASSGIPRRV